MFVREMYCSSYIGPDGLGRRGRFSWRNGEWTESAFECTIDSLEGMSYVVPAMPIEVHCHGLGALDFSQLRPEQLVELDTEACRHGLYVVPTVYVRARDFERFSALLDAFVAHKKEGGLSHVLGFAMEGPLLGGVGGIPKGSAWDPGRDQWKQLAGFGRLGALRYMVMAPDAVKLVGGFEWLLPMFVEAGIKPAFGHFRRDDPNASARAVDEALDVIARTLGRTDAAAVITDHLFNDMPRNFTHTWRTAAEKTRRESERAAFLEKPWRWDNIDELLGPVPSAIMRAGRDGRLTICMNFDGEHVDLEICRRAVEFVGADNFIAITDHTDRPALAGESLHSIPGSSLRYQEDGIVAVGALDVDAQMENMRRIGLSEGAIWKMFAFNPLRVFGVPFAESPSSSFTVVGEDGARYAPAPQEHLQHVGSPRTDLRRLQRAL